MKNSIKVERAIHELTQEQLAQKLGVSRQTIHAIEANKYVPSTVLALKLAQLFDKQVGEINNKISKLRNTDAVVEEDGTVNWDYRQDSIITRIGENCRVMFCGDFRQADLKANGLQDFIKVLKRMDRFTFIEFEVEDIVRSDFVKQYIIAKNELKL